KQRARYQSVFLARRKRDRLSVRCQRPARGLDDAQRWLAGAAAHRSRRVGPFHALVARWLPLLSLSLRRRAAVDARVGYERRSAERRSAGAGRRGASLVLARWFEVHRRRPPQGSLVERPSRRR